MIKKFTFVVVIVSALMALLLLSPIALGWFHDATVSDASVDGAIIGSYFEYGDGSAEHPFGIAQPKQLYYLAWLQDLGYFNKVENGQVKQTYFELSDMYGSTIDFSEGDTPYVIPPIGTTTYPFVGSFNGNGVTLANLTVDNEYLELVTPPQNDNTVAYGEVLDGVQIVGLFGVVGAIGADTTAATATVNGGTYATSVNQVTNLKVDGITIKSTTPKNNYTVLGVLAGYVNGAISSVAISNSSVNVGNGITHLDSVEGNNPVISDFGLVGFCMDPYKEALSITSVTANLPVETQNIIYKSTQSEGEGFGGSMKLDELYSRLVSTYNQNTEFCTFVSEEHWIVNNQTGETTHDTSRDVYTTSYSTRTYTVEGSSTSPSVSYTFSTYASTSTNNTTTYMYLFGQSTVEPVSGIANSQTIKKTIYTEEYKNVTKTAYLLSVDAVRTGDAAGTTISYNDYYFNINNSGNGFSSGTDKYTATAWQVPTSGGSGNVSTKLNGNTYYLVFTATGTGSGTISFTTNSGSATTFTRDGNGRLYTSLRYNYRNRTYYLYCYNGNFSVSSSSRNLVYNDAVYDQPGYMNINAAGTGLTMGTDSANATKWIMENNTIYTVVDDYPRYINNNNNNALTLGDTSTTTWHYNNSSTTTIYYQTTSTGYYGGTTNHYMIYNNGWTTTTTSTNITRTTSSFQGYMWDTTSREEPSSYTTPGTYFAINMSDSTTTMEGNTGYIVSGSNFKNNTATNSNERYPSKSGDIRVSQYTKSSSLETAYGTDSSGSQTNSRLEIVTPRFTNGVATWYRVSDDYNKNNSENNVSSSIKSFTKMNYMQLGLKRYEDARSALTSILGGTNIYGLHFMDSTISVDNYVTIPHAMIYGEEIENLQVPADCIDFRVRRRGFVTVFAGTYFTGNTSFFSLHEITRDDDGNLSTIKEIVEIYNPTGNSNDFIYKYSDGSYSSNKERGSLAFKLEWMTNPGNNLKNNAVYYFEIPVNGGEYALGSVPGNDGAYLFYLDIAANAGQAEDKDRRTITELFKTYEYDFELPKGVQLVETGDSYDAEHPYETVLVKYKDGFNGNSLLNITEGVFGYTDNVNTELSYVGGTLSSSSGSGGSIYYPKGYKIKRIEHIIDKGRDTANSDIMRVEYIDSYNSSGSFAGRVVDIYAGIDVTDKEEDLVKVISFTYTSNAGYDSTVMRCVRAASIGGFNIVFNQDVTIASTTVTEEDVHVNFGDSAGSTLISAFKDSPLQNQTVVAVNMVYAENNIENAYVAPAYGDELLEYYYYKKSSASSTDKTIYFKTVSNELSMTDKNSNLVLTPKLAYQVNSQTLNYNVDISTDGDAFTVYAWLLDGSNRTIATHTEDSATSGKHVVEANVTIAIGSVKLNGTTLTTQKQDIEVSSGS